MSAKCSIHRCEVYDKDSEILCIECRDAIAALERELSDLRNELQREQDKHARLVVAALDYVAVPCDITKMTLDRELSK